MQYPQWEALKELAMKDISIIISIHVDSLENVDVEVLAEAAGVVVEDGLGISKALQDEKDFHGLGQEGEKRK